MNPTQDTLIWSRARCARLTTGFQDDLDGHGARRVRFAGAGEELVPVRDADPERHSARWRRDGHRDKLAPGDGAGGIGYDAMGWSRKGSARRSVVHDRHQIGDVCHDRRGNAATYEAISAGRDFEDIQSR